MPENASVLQVWQFGVESTPGTAATVNRIIRDWGLELSPQVPSSEVQPTGNIWPTGVLYGKEHTEGRIGPGENGLAALGYQSGVYLMESLLHTVSPTTPAGGSGGWTLTITGTPTGGTFTITFNGVTSAGIAYNAAAAAVQSALEAMSTIGTGNVTVTGSALPGNAQTIVFAGPLTNTPLALTTSGAGLTGGSSPASAVVAVNTASASRRWFYTPAQSALDSVKTFTIEKGSSVSASRVTYGQVTDFEVNYTQEAVSIGGRLLAGRTTDNFGSLTGSPTEVLVKPVAAPEVTVWMGNTYLGMTRMNRPLEARLSVGNRFGPVFTLNDQQTSFGAVAQLPASAGLSLTVEHDTDTHGFLTDMRSGTTKFVRVEAVGPTIETGYPYRVAITMPMKLRNPSRGSQQGVYATTWELMAVYAENYYGTRDGAIEVEIINSLTAL